MQTSVQNSSSIRLGSGTLSIDGVNVGALEKAKLDVTFKVLQLKADNTRLAPRKSIDKVQFSANLFEILLANLEKIDGFGTATDTAGASIPVTAEVLRASGTFAATDVLYFANANGDKTAVSSVVVKNGATTLTAGTDYVVVLGSDGRTGIARVGTSLTLTGIGLNVSYSYVPNVKKTYTFNDVVKAIGYYEVKFENVDENGKKFSITIPKGFNTENLTFEFASDEKLDEAMKYPVKFEAFPDASNRLLVIEDEQAV